MYKNVYIILTAFVSLHFAACSSDEKKENPTPTTTQNNYLTTSSTGDLASWSFAGSTFSVDWNVTDSLGAIVRTYDISGTCGAPDATFNYRTCTIASITCSTGCMAGDPIVGDTLYVFEIPGAALLVARENDDEIHAGFVNKGCATTGIEGDYLFTTLHPGDSSIFGMYRMTPTSLVGPFPQSLTHADFGFNSSDPSNDTILENVELAYSDPNGATSINNATCQNGVHTIVTPDATVRVNITQSGLFLVDKPSGAGGLVSFRVDAAATLADLSGKSFVGLTFPDDGSPAQLARAVLGTSTGTPAYVPVNSVEFLGGSGPTVTTQQIYPVADVDGSIPNLPDLSAVPADHNGQTWSTNPMAAAFPTVSTIPGLFVITPETGDRGKVVFAATKSGGKVIMLGAIYNVRTISAQNRFVNTGAFLFFED